jgi:hypothetical protein
VERLLLHLSYATQSCKTLQHDAPARRSSSTMGIKGLLKCLGSITEDAHAREFAGKTCVVDSYAWLHRGAYSCAKELATGQSTRRYIVSRPV